MSKINQKHIALVTGGNRGIGLAICRQLAAQSIHVILGSRDAAKGQEIAQTLQQQGLDVVSHQLDVTDAASINRMLEFVKTTYGKLDILVNNAGVFADYGIRILDLEIALLQNTLEANLYGPLLLCQAFIPLMQKHNYGRIVNVSSGYGSLDSMSMFESDGSSYKISKAALNALTRMLAAEVKGSNIKVNTMCPGWVRTDMGGPQADRSPDEGAETAVWLATLPDEGPTNGFFRDKSPIPW